MVRGDTSEALQPQLIPETEKPSRRPTGRARHRRLRVDRALALDLAALRRAGLFRRPAGSPLATRWLSGLTGEAVAEVAYSTMPGGPRAPALALSDAIGGQREHALYVVPLEWLPCPFGGFRAWLRCPACDRRCRIVYRPLHGARFECRLCAAGGLTYASRQAHRGRFYEGLVRPLRVAEATSRWREPRCSVRRKLRALARLEKALPAARALGGEA